MNKYKIPQYMLLSLFVVFVSVPLYAAEVEGVYYRDRFVVGNKKLRLTGVGLLRYWGFKAYTTIVDFLKKEGYDVKNLQKVQHS